MRTGKHLKIESMGDAVLGVRLEGNPAKPEPIHFRVCFPGGDVDIVRCSDGSNWVHFRVNREDDMTGETGHLVDARIDAEGLPVGDKVEILDDPRVYHVAFRVVVAK